MFRMFIAAGSLLLDVATFAAEGALAATMLLAGIIITALHFACESASFQSVVNRMTGCDLPESLPSVVPTMESVSVTESAAERSELS